MLSIAGLFASWVLGVACVIVGSGAVTKPTISAATSAFSNDTALDGPYHDWPQVELSQTAAELLPLLLSFVITMLIESMGLIHATTLRWALGDRLAFSSNLRLFTSAPLPTLCMPHLSLCHTSQHRSCLLSRRQTFSATNFPTPLVMKSTMDAGML